jgi:hypothetical protein
MTTVASSARSMNDVHYALLRHPPSVPLVLMTSRVDVILLVVGTLHMTSHFSLLAPYPTERLAVILHQNSTWHFFSGELLFIIHSQSTLKLTEWIKFSSSSTYFCQHFWETKQIFRLCNFLVSCQLCALHKPVSQSISYCHRPWSESLTCNAIWVTMAVSWPRGIRIS